MIKEDKDLLLRDLCGRLPYGVKCQCYDGRIIASLTGVKSETELYFYEFDYKEDDGIIEIEFCKPYLFPLSSMTEEQEKEYHSIIYRGAELYCNEYCDVVDIDFFDTLQEFYHKNHFDYRGLIPMGSAIDATGLNIY